MNTEVLEEKGSSVGQRGVGEEAETQLTPPEAEGLPQVRESRAGLCVPGQHGGLGGAGEASPINGTGGDSEGESGPSPPPLCPLLTPTSPATDPLSCPSLFRIGEW